MFLSGLVEYLKNVFIGLHRIKYNFYINSLEFGLKLCLVVVLLHYNNSVIYVINSFIIALFVTAAIGFFLLYKNFYKHLHNSTVRFSKEIFNYSLPLAFISIGFIALTEIDTIMIGYFSTTAEVGTYAVAKQIINKLPHIAMAISMGTMPVYAKMNKENKEELKTKFYSITKTTIAIYAIIALLLFSLSSKLIPFLFGEEYINAILPLQILSVYLFFMGMSIILGSFLDYTGNAKKRAYNISATIVLNIVLNIVLVPRYGAIGAALATSVSYLPYVLFNWIEVRKVLNSL